MPDIPSFPECANCPTVSGYGYSPDAGLVRTEMTDGVVRQRRKWTNARLTITLRFELKKACLLTVEEFITSVGADWWVIYLLTGKAGSEFELHTVRIVDNPKINMLSGQNMFEYLLTVETNGALVIS